MIPSADNWVRAYDWQMKRQGNWPCVYWVERWQVPLFWNMRRWMRGN